MSQEPIGKFICEVQNGFCKKTLSRYYEWSSIAFGTSNSINFTGKLPARSRGINDRSKPSNYLVKNQINRNSNWLSWNLMSNRALFSWVNLQGGWKTWSAFLEKLNLRKWYNNYLYTGLPATIDVLDMIELNRERNWFENALPPISDEASFNMRRRLM